MQAVAPFVVSRKTNATLPTPKDHPGWNIEDEIRLSAMGNVAILWS